MMPTGYRGLFAVLFAATALAACTGCGGISTRSFSATLATDRAVSLDHAHLELIKRGVSGESTRTCYFMPFGRLFVSGPSCDEALHNALEASGGDVLLNNTTIESGHGFRPFVWTYVVQEKGDAYRVKSNQ